MKVHCLYNTGEAYKNDKMPVGYFPTSQYNLVVGKEYQVMGIMLCEKLIMYLVDEDGAPFWIPYQLFKVIDNTLGKKWFFKMFSKEESPSIEAIWGYEELCMMDGYYDKLLDRDEEAMLAYFRRKMEMYEQAT